MKLIRSTLLLTLLLSALFPSAGKAQDTAVQVPLWSNGAPGSESRRNEPEEAKDYWVKNIHNPSITIYLPPKDKATGAAVVIFPGGVTDYWCLTPRAGIPQDFSTASESRLLSSSTGYSGKTRQYILLRERRGRMPTGPCDWCAAERRSGVSIREGSGRWDFLRVEKSRIS